MSGYSVIHQFGVNTDFENYQYYEVLVPAGTITLKGTSITTVGAPIVLPVGVTSSGGTSGTMYLMGKKKPEAYRNADGTYPIR